MPIVAGEVQARAAEAEVGVGRAVRQIDAGVAQPRGIQISGAGGAHRGLHIGQQERQPLVSGDRATELLLLSAPHSIALRLGLDPAASSAQCRAAALATGDRWRARVSVSLLEGPMLEAAELAVRLADRLANQSS